MKCNRCGGRVMRDSDDGRTCINCGRVFEEPTRIFVRALSPQVPQPITVKIATGLRETYHGF